MVFIFPQVDLDLPSSIAAPAMHSSSHHGRKSGKKSQKWDLSSKKAKCCHSEFKYFFHPVYFSAQILNQKLSNKKMTHKPTLQQFLWTSIFFPQVTKSAWWHSWWPNPNTIQEANHATDNSSCLLRHMARPFPSSWLSIPSCRSLPGKKNKKSCRPSRHIERRVKKLRLLIAFAQISLASFACRPCSACGVLSRPSYWRGGS